MSLCVLRAAAVVGSSFDIQLLRNLPYLEEIGDRIADSLEPAIDAGVVRWQAPHEEGEAVTVYAFTHELAREAVVASIRLPLLAEIHHQVAAVLASSLGPQIQAKSLQLAQELFGHRRAALPSYPDQAIPLADVSVTLGNALLSELDEAGASEAFTTGLAALESCNESSPKLQAQLLLGLAGCPSTSTEHRRGALRKALTALLSRPESEPELLVSLAREYSITNPFGIEDATIRGALEEVLVVLAHDRPDLRAQLNARLALHYVWCPQAEDGALPSAQKLADAAWAEAQLADRPLALMDALDARGGVLCTGPDVEALLDVGRKMRDLGVRMTIYEMIALLRLGDRQGFDAALERAFSEGGSPWPNTWMHLAFCSQFLALRALLAGELEEGVNHTQEIFDRYHDHDVNFAQIVGATLLWAAYQANGPDVAQMLVDAVATEYPSVPAYKAASTLFLARRGDITGAASALDQMLVPGLDALRRDTCWSVCLGLLAEATVLSAANQHASVLYEALQPYAGQVLVLASGVLCYGAADRFLGMLCPLLPDRGLREAEQHFERAVELEAGLGVKALHVYSLFWFGRSLARFGSGDQMAWALDLLDDAASSAPPELLDLQRWIVEERAVLHRYQYKRHRPRQV